jgi:DNA-3-methyladenine glycosylase I
MSDIPPITPQAEAMSKELKRRGFRFIGPTVMYAHMQATGMVNDHLVTCPRHTEVMR